MSKFDIRDWTVMGVVTSMWIASTIFLFIHATETNFGVWASLGSVMTGTYHWLNIHDQKTPDAG